MVLGSGLVGSGFKAFRDDDRYLVFASGVSNSAASDFGAFERESNLLKRCMQEHPDKTIIYFGTCSVYDPAQREISYVAHKLAMEALVQEQHNQYHIFRISNLAGKTDNPHTVLNFFAQHIRSGESFFAWKHASRNIIDIDDAVALCSHVIRQGLFKNEILNIANTMNYPVSEIIGNLEMILRKKGHYDLIDKGNSPHIDSLAIKGLLDALDIHFDKVYLTRTLKKYYAVNDL
jgi:nucleoside-diphosphate-sugar epimerase